MCALLDRREMNMLSATIRPASRCRLDLLQVIFDAPAGYDVAKEYFGGDAESSFFGVEFHLVLA